jgi:hypothetical protein
MNPDTITVGTLITLTDGTVGVVTHIASDDDPSVPANTPVRVRLKDEGAMIQVAYAEIADARPPSS